MRLQPRHYLYLVLLAGLAIYNGVRLFRAHHVNVGTTVIHLDQGPRSTSPVWSVFDRAATLRDAPDAQFSAALQTLSQSIDNSNAVPLPPETTPQDLDDLRGCRTWLLFYRQEFLHPAVNKPGWHDQLTQHVISCAANHRDAAQ